MSIIQHLDGRPLEQIAKSMLRICESQLHFLEKAKQNGSTLTELYKFIREMNHQKEAWEIVIKTLASSGKQAESGSPVTSKSEPTHQTDGTEKLEKLLREASSRKLTRGEIWDQRVNFVYGQLASDNPDITREEIEQTAIETYGPRPTD